MTPKNKARLYLRDNCSAAYEWLNEQLTLYTTPGYNPAMPFDTWAVSSGVSSYKIIRDAIAAGGYKHPSADRTWLTVIELLQAFAGDGYRIAMQ